MKKDEKLKGYKRSVIVGPFQRDTLISDAIPTEKNRESTLKVLLLIRDDLVGKNNNLQLLQDKKVEKYLKYLLSILAPAVLEFFRTEVQNYLDDTELWFCNFFKVLSLSSSVGIASDIKVSR